jgi:hypothetical protein
MRKKAWSIAMLAAVACSATGAAAGGFKAKYYVDCYTPVSQARELVPPPPPDIAGTAKKAGDVAGMVSKLGGFGGFGGFGGLGSAASSVAKYSNVISDAAQFTSKMKQDYPDAATRVAAYGDKMANDAGKVAQAGDKVDAAAACYAKAHDSLKASVAANEIKEGEAKDRQKEIVGGIDEANGVVSDARSTMNTNIKSYNDAINGDTQGMGLDLGSIASMAGTAAGAAGVTPASAMGLPKVPGVADTPEAQAAAWQAAAAAQQNGYSATNTQAQNYAALAKTKAQMDMGQLQDPTKMGGPSVAAAGSSFGALDNLSRLSVLSKGPMGGANLAAEAMSAARSNPSAGGTVVVAPPASLSPEMMASLAKAGADSSKYMGTYQRLSAQSDSLASLKANVASLTSTATP